MDDLKSLAELAVEYLDLLATSTKEVVDAQKETTEYVNLLIDSTKKRTAAENKATDATGKLTNAKKDLWNKSKNLGNEFINVIDAGTKLGQSLGVSATQGVSLEFKNRLNSIKSLVAFDANLVVTTEQLKEAQQGFADVFMGAREGMQISADGSRAFVQDLKKGFGSEFQPTAETFRMLTQMGMSTTTQFEAFRKSTGRASLSNQQLTTLYGKNTLSFLLYGNKFGKAAVQAERLGVNLASVQAAQEGLVTNLDGTIDTVAQMNQLGANIDFGNLVRIAETEGPDALMAYVRATVPEQMMQSASTRALFKQLGISVEDYLKSGQKQVSAADQLEARMSEQATAIGTATKVFTYLTRAFDVGLTAFGSLIASAYVAAKSLFELAVAQRAAARLAGATGPSSALSATSLFGAGAAEKGGMAARMASGKASAGSAMGIGGALVAGGLAGFDMYAQTKDMKKSIVAGLIAILSTVLTTFLIGMIPVVGPFLAPFIGPMIGTFIGKKLTSMLLDDATMMPTGYGERSLVTSTGGVYAFNNSDSIFAGTDILPADDFDGVQRLPKGSLQFKPTPTPQVGTTDRATSDLVRKVDALISAMEKANMTIDINGSTQQVPRMSVKTVQVLSRNER